MCHLARSRYNLFQLALLLLICATPLSALAANNLKPIQNILILHSYHQGLAWTDSISQGIEAEFADISDTIELHYEYLDTKRNFSDAYLKRIGQFIQYKTFLNNINYSLIICADNNALEFVVKYGDELYPGIPVVFCAINNFSPSLLKGKKNITGIVEAMDYKDTLKLISKLHPNRNNILVIVDKTPTGEAIKKEIEMVEAEQTDNFTFEYYQEFLLEEVADKISSLGENDLIYLLTFNRDSVGHFISYIDGARMIRKFSKVPIYGGWDFYFGNGIVGGLITSGFSQGQEAARMAKRILAGVPASAIPTVTESPNQYMFDYNEMKAFGIKISQLPEDSIFINLPESLYEQYKQLIIPLLFIITCTAIVLLWRLIIQYRRQKFLKKTNQELDRRVEEQTSALKQKNELLTIEIAERIKLEEEIRKLASTDSLTGLHNRRSFMEKAEAEQIRSHRYKKSYSILMMDIDFFKKINDTYGHPIGDKALQAFTKICLQTLRENDILGRWGGEEFVAILVESEQEEALQVAERLRRNIAQTKISAGEISFQLKVSIGVAQCLENDTTVELIMQRADNALYEAKNQGRNRVVFHEGNN